MYDALVLLLAAVILVIIFGRLHISPILGYLVAGIVIGPPALGVIDDVESIHLLAELGVVFLLFTIGLELSFERLKVMRRYVLGLGLSQVFLTSLAIAAAAWLLGVSIEVAIIIGGGLALSSTAFVIQLLIEREEHTTRFGRISFAVLIFQDLAVLPLLVFITLLDQPHDTVLTSLLTAGVKAGIALTVIMLVGRILLRPLYRLIAAIKSPELFAATTLLVVIGTSWIMAELGLSMALGAFLAGLMLAETEYRHQVEADIRPFRGILLGLFFMSVGMSIETQVISQHLIAVFSILITLFLLKFAIVSGLVRLFDRHWPVAIRTGALLSQAGEFGFVLFGVAVFEGAMDPELGQVLIAVIALGLLFTPLMVHIGSHLARYVGERSSADVSQHNGELEPVQEHILIAGFGRVGQTIAKMLFMFGVPYVAIDSDHHRVARCRARGMPVFFGDASRVEILTLAGAERARAAIITVNQTEDANKAVTALHQHCPRLPIFVRAKDKKHSEILQIKGATAVVPEMIEASLQLGSIMLKDIGVSEGDVAHVIQNIRQEDYQSIKDIVPGGNER